MIQDSIGSIVYGCRLDDPGCESQQMQKIFSSPKRPNWICVSPNLLLNGHWRAVSLGVEWPGREADHLHPCSAEVKNEWCCLHSLCIP